jgi:lycopene cyclase domain-containing protein
MSLYSILLLCSIIVPLSLSFDKKLQFSRQWKYLVPSILVIAFFYLAFDIYFTKMGVWGFNPHYHSFIVFCKLPLEEWLFFVVIPYASIFLHDSIVLYFSKIILPDRIARYISIALIIISLIILLFNMGRAYTAYIFSLIILVLIISFFDKTNVVKSFYCTFLVIILPFVIVNAILTGSFIEEPVVWYNNNENLGIRFLTIPVEDFGYAFSLILFNLLLRNKLKKD